MRFDKHSHVVKSITVLKILDAFGAHLEKPQRFFKRFPISYTFLFSSIVCGWVVIFGLVVGRRVGV